MSTLTQAAPLARFHAAHAHKNTYRTALGEIRSGVKLTHWMWFIFPSMVTKPGASTMSKQFAIADRDAAADYLADPVLALRLYNCTVGVLRHDKLMFHQPDARKLRASVTLFAQVAKDPAVLNKVLEKFFDGPDPRTLLLLKAQEDGTVEKYWEAAREAASLAEPQPRTLFAEPDRETLDEFDPWTRGDVESFIRGCGITGAALRLIVGAWMADQDRAYDAGWNAHADANSPNR